jgi:hypothetical protein
MTHRPHSGLSSLFHQTTRFNTLLLLAAAAAVVLVAVAAVQVVTDHLCLESHLAAGLLLNPRWCLRPAQVTP